MSAYSGNIVVVLILVVVVVAAAAVPVHLFVAFCLASCCLHCPPVAACWQGLTIAYNSELTLPISDPLQLFRASLVLISIIFCMNAKLIMSFSGALSPLLIAVDHYQHAHTHPHTLAHTLNSLKSKCVCYLLLCLPSG